LHHLGLGIDLEIAGVRARLIQCDPGRHRAGERGEIEIHGCLLGGLTRAVAARVDFYTVSHNMNPVKGFIAKWYKKVKSCHLLPPESQSGAGGRAPIGLTSRSARHSTCFARAASPRHRSTISVAPPA